ncbi:MAG: Formamidopyrimidine-DNA glycosylase [Gemmatimonadaceae bacterium]|nr:Formamidopyrimidine-DNA glycosylase [Gemmatimonadaceae bacterium]
MPELPDVELYVEALRARVLGKAPTAIRIVSPFVLRSVDPPVTEFIGRPIVEIRRLGKRIVFQFEGDVYVVVHLMIAGRLRWRGPGGKVPGKIGLVYIEFVDGVLILTEAGTRRRASLHLVRGASLVAAMDRGGLEVMGSTLSAFAERLRRENRTVKRSLTDPRLFSGIGKAYSDEILHRARISPMLLTSRMTHDQIVGLHRATQDVLGEWIGRLRAESKGEFPEKVTAFREGMAVHGRFGLPCPVCDAPVQRIRYADNETNYCARCQNADRILADRALSRLLKEDFPRTLDDEE